MDDRFCGICGYDDAVVVVCQTRSGRLICEGCQQAAPTVIDLQAHLFRARNLLTAPDQSRRYTP